MAYMVFALVSQNLSLYTSASVPIQTYKNILQILQFIHTYSLLIFSYKSHIHTISI